MGPRLRCHKRSSLEGLKEGHFCVSDAALAVRAAADSGPCHLVRDLWVQRQTARLTFLSSFSSPPHGLAALTGGLALQAVFLHCDQEGKPAA